ncbi:MAG: hypothetical protein LBJ12_05245 [Oscillospiraceae bacterium]|nr:hypothetical protein [Oscillospiraceae bacterium]
MTLAFAELCGAKATDAMAFQMIDDIFDINEDAAAGRITFAALWGVDKTRMEAKALAKEAKEALAVFGSNNVFWRHWRTGYLRKITEPKRLERS